MKKLHALLLAAVASCTISAAPIRTLGGLANVTFYEVTSSVNPFLFTPNSVGLTTRAADPLNNLNADFVGAPTENYDVFYSDANGALNINGDFITIEGIYGAGGSGFNIGEVQLNFNNGSPSLFANSIASSVPGATNYLAANLNNILDGNTATAMGMNGVNQRMRVTVGFADPAPPPTGVPEPSTWMLGLAGLGGVFAMRRRQ